MTKEIFTAKPYLNKAISVFMLLGSIFILFLTYIGISPEIFNEWVGCLSSFLGIAMAYFFWKIPPQKIEIDESGIKKIISSQVKGPMSKLLQSDTECKWNWISSVVSTRYEGGPITTILYTSESIPNKPKSLVSFDSLAFKDYVSILRIIKERAPHASFDETTSLVLDNQLDIRSIRPFFWWLLIVVVIIGLVYGYYFKD